MTDDPYADLLPRPVSARAGAGALPLTVDATLAAGPGTETAASWLRSVFAQATGLPLLPAESTATATIDLRLDDAHIVAEGYRLEISPTRVSIRAGDAAGAFYAVQTLRQLAGVDAHRVAAVHTGGWSLPVGSVVDAPRFGHRGALLDVARNFLPKYEVFRFIDLLAAHKLNVLHLHLTDDQGWRAEIRRYPRLTEVGAWRSGSPVEPTRMTESDGRPHGGFYTQQDLREIVAYASARHITVVPEVDVPGHVQAAIAAYPELGELPEPVEVWTRWGINPAVLRMSENSVEFFCNVFDELLEIFPSELICVGGDEVPTEQWERSEQAHQQVARLGLSGVAELPGWFIRELTGHLRSRGRRVLGWDEIVDTGALGDGVVVASWRGEEAGRSAAEAGHEVVMCPETRLYLDHRQSADEREPLPVGWVHTLADVYHYEPVPAGTSPAAASRIRGAQAHLWSEYLDGPRRLDYAAFPRLSALAEVVWSPAERAVSEFLDRLARAHLPRLAAMGVEYRPLSGPLPWQQRPGVVGLPRERAADAESPSAETDPSR